MTTRTPAELLDLPLPENDSGADTVRGYLTALLTALWREEADFSGKRPFGNSSWQYDLYAPMIAAGLVPGELDEDGAVEVFDYAGEADEMILAAIAALGEPGIQVHYFEDAQQALATTGHLGVALPQAQEGGPMPAQ